ncbi:hypothetical protein ACFWNR_06240 [Streptomyces virginiae]
MASREKGGWPSDPIIHHRKETVMPDTCHCGGRNGEHWHRCSDRDKAAS